MNKFLAKLSLYDFLTTILLGGCVYYLFSATGLFDEILCQPPAVKVGIYYVMGLLTHKIVEALDFASKINNNANRSSFGSALLSPLCRNQLSIIKSSMLDVGIRPIPFDEEINDIYFKTYYGLLRKNALYNVPRMEAHSAFIKDMIYVFPFLVFSVVYQYSCCCIRVEIWLFSIIIEAGLVAARYNTEYKIHHLIWEGYKYRIF